MNRFVKLTAVLASACMLFSGIGIAHADDLENMLSNRQQILNQFNQDTNHNAQTQLMSIHVNPPAVEQLEGSADELIKSAMGLLGVAYRYGGTSARTGFDCSGFMQHIFRRTIGLNLPRTSAEQAKMGAHVNRSELQPGDMVFFRTMGRGRISHVGLYIGNNRFIHAPRTGKNIEITSLSNKYWNSKYAFGRRVKKNDPTRFLN
ncbi:C40 family peptidase [Neisseria iguanae]|uniref:Peptidoglycan endopeptidase n=1 Tax=Neisseria iguanae TaxID=90242 RepID=A0A2P7TY91_9NEIS|nr:C40 family peptidase [Neisseria iguanae]PSJ79677.1 peptidoglycan endopeptidase [Neisseria iguanae]